MPEKVQKSPLISEGNYTVVEVKELNYFDLSGEKSKTKGTSCKQYHAELQASKTDDKCQIYTIWGATGASNQTKEWRHYSNKYAAEKDFAAIIKSKIKKGYHEIDVAQRAQGSVEAKAIVKPVTLKGAEQLPNVLASKLPKATQNLVESLFGQTQNFISSVLKCPLGQLTNNQVDRGRDILIKAKSVIDTNKSFDKKQLDLLQDYTNEFYAEIPHNLGQGARGQMTHLLLDSSIKIAQKEQDLDDLIDAKSVGAQLVGNDIDDKYRSLCSDIEPIDIDSYDAKWIQNMMEGTKASNHRMLGKIKLLDVWKLSRNKEHDVFINNAERIAKECGKQVAPDVLIKYVKERPKLDKEIDELYKKSNTLPLWHGTRSSSLIGIIKNGLLIRPSGAILSGSAYGNACYKGMASKSINYSSIKTSYWAKGQDDTAFMFLLDVCLGNSKVVSSSGNYTAENIKPFHSVWAKGGYSGVINDEWMTYHQAGPKQQFKINYIVKFTCEK